MASEIELELELELEMELELELGNGEGLEVEGRSMESGVLIGGVGELALLAKVGENPL